MKSYLCLLFILLSSSIFSQSSKPSITREPAWITKNIVDYGKVSLDKDATDGYVDIDFETQVSLADQTEYTRRSKKIISQAGIQNGSQLSINFDPSFQQLFFHSIHIIRAGEMLNKLKLADIKIVHQETELNNFIYNGSLNALLILEDVRQGDIIEYSYSIKGFNPIFKNKYSQAFYLQYSIPVYDLFIKLIVPAGKKVNIKNINHNLQPIITTANGGQIYEWHKNNISPLVTQDYKPSWYDPFAQLFISEFNNWKEVNDWAMELFPDNKELSPAIKAKIKEIEAAYASLENRTRAALRFVQDDIRYMGVEMGENSHKPADPSKIFAQRFGDCKEKSYLLFLMLKAMGISANIVLINTDAKQTIDTWLPAPTNFDHCTIRVKLGNTYYWFDPTIAYQRGDIKDLFYPDYQVGLVVAESTIGLTNIPFRSISYQHLKEVFKVAYMYGNGTLTVTTTFKGWEADHIRNSYNTESDNELMTNNKKFYATYYDDIKADSISHVDDDSTGLFTTYEYYTLPKFWTVEKGEYDKFSIWPFVIDANFTRPKEKDRKMPFRLPYPINYEEEVIVDLPSDWKATESETHLKNAGFVYNSKFYCENNRIHYVSDYENLKNNITPSEAAQYFSDLKDYNAGVSFEITSGKKNEVIKPSSSAVRDRIIIIVLVIVIVAGFILRMLRDKKFG